MRFLLWHILFLFLTGCSGLSAQINSIRTLDVPTWYDNHLAVSSEGEVYLASELKEAQNSFRRGSYLVKFDSCNQILWKRIYQRPDFAMNVHDLVVAPNGELLMMGITEYKDIFLLRLTPAGEIIFAYRYHYSAHDFNYTILASEDRILIFGNSFFGGGTPTRNFVLCLDAAGNILWSNNYLANEQAGEALQLPNGSIFCQSGAYAYLVDADGQLLWARQYPFIPPESALSNPVAGPDGAIYFTYRNDEDAHYLVKLDAAGIPQWIRTGVPAVDSRGSLTQTPDGLVWMNSRENTNGILRPLLVHFAFSGEIVDQFQLEWPDAASIRLPELHFVARDQTIAGFATLEDEPFRDLYLRTTLEADICYLQTRTETVPVTNLPTFESVSFPVDEIPFTRLLIPSVDTRFLDFAVTDWCRENDPKTPETLEVFLNCGESYSYQSPFPGLPHFWQDGSTETNRTFDQPGIYELLISDCTTGYPVRLEIAKEACSCELEFPTAFSPNGDDLNDFFRPVYECPFLDYQLLVFNRWGQIIFRSADPEQGWNGTAGGRRLSAGLYTWQCSYRPDDGIGTGSFLTQYGEIHLLR